MKRHSETKMMAADQVKVDNVETLKRKHGNSSTSTSRSATLKSNHKPKIRVRIRRYHGVAKWTWNAGGNNSGDNDEDEVCGICQSAFEGVAPGVKYPGDECPVVFGKCSHAFHLQCLSKWLEGSRNNTCPMCRQDWEFFGESSSATATTSTQTNQQQAAPQVAADAAAT